jgi:hypothetical protein
LLLALGGALWIPVGVLEFVQPWGTPVRYDEGRAYDVVVERWLYRVSAAPGSLALTLTGLGLLGLLLSSPSGSRAMRPALTGAGSMVLLGAASVVGVLFLFDPVATGMRMLGLLVTGAACASAFVVCRSDGSRAGVRRALAALAVLAPLAFAMWPLVYAVDLVPPAGAASVTAAFGLAWVSLAIVAGAGSRRTSDLAVAAPRPRGDQT